MPSLNSAFTLSAGRVIRQTEAAIGTLHAVILSALFLLLKFAFAGDDEHAVFDRDFDLFLFDLGQFGLDEVFLVIFGNVNQWRPFCEGDRFLVTIPTL